MDTAQVIGLCRSVLSFSDPEYSRIPKDTPPKQIAPKFIKSCLRHGKEPIHDFRALVSPAQLARLQDCFYLDSVESLNTFSSFVYGLNIQKISDWWRHKEIDPWIIPCIIKSRACPEHHGRQLHFCGLCLRDRTSGIFPQENEDKVTWPGVIATCSVLMYSDSDVRLAVLEFVSRSHGSIACVSRAAFENHWLQTYTKIEGMRQHAVAAALYSGSPLDMQNIVSQVRDLAVKDWVRARLVQGCWLHPSDVQWSPARSITNTPEPPGHGLEQELGSAYDFHLRRLLLEPMRGMVKILIHKAQADGVDPSLRCARVGMLSELTLYKSPSHSAPWDRTAMNPSKLCGEKHVHLYTSVYVLSALGPTWRLPLLYLSAWKEIAPRCMDLLLSR
ncbi:hypothetical protein B0H10DRAFT_1957607 [Mycena sp. CBHHK59/15]|nr:hypothetical protein B0H10DRAFT_1957607 [Mycena sp. CBHHK59/15]